MIQHIISGAVSRIMHCPAEYDEGGAFVRHIEAAHEGASRAALELVRGQLGLLQVHAALSSSQTHAMACPSDALSSDESYHDAQHHSVAMITTALLQRHPRQLCNFILGRHVRQGKAIAVWHASVAGPVWRPSAAAMCMTLPSVQLTAMCRWY